MAVQWRLCLVKSNMLPLVIFLLLTLPLHEALLSPEVVSMESLGAVKVTTEMFLFTFEEAYTI